MPKVFIGSSVSQLGLAYAVQDNLEHDCEVVVWTQGIFGINEYPLQSLINELNQCDFGIFIFHPEDLLLMKDSTNQVVRDNVLFEFGLFIGRLGLDRTFFIAPRGMEMHLPSDLTGLSPLAYSYNNTYKDDHKKLVQLFGPVCNKIRGHLKKFAPQENVIDRLNLKIDELETTRSAALVLHGTIEHSQFFDVDYDALTNALQGAFNRVSSILGEEISIVSNSIFELSEVDSSSVLTEIGKVGGGKRLHLNLDTSSEYVVQYYKEKQKQYAAGKIPPDMRLPKLLRLKELKSLRQFEYQLITIIDVALGLISSIQFRVSKIINEDLIEPFVEEFVENNDGLFQIVISILERRTSDEQTGTKQKQ